MPPVDEDSGEDLERNIDQDYQSIQELDQYERESVQFPIYLLNFIQIFLIFM